MKKYFRKKGSIFVYYLDPYANIVNIYFHKKLRLPIISSLFPSHTLHCSLLSKEDCLYHLLSLFILNFSNWDQFAFWANRAHINESVKIHYRFIYSTSEYLEFYWKVSISWHVATYLAPVRLNLIFVPIYTAKHELSNFW